MPVAEAASSAAAADQPPAKAARRADSTTASADIHRTGAKPVAEGPDDPLLPGAEYHARGLLRTKPGRGPPSRSMSCSDKIMRWTFLGGGLVGGEGVGVNNQRQLLALGLQGALLSPWIEPIFLSGIIVGDHYDVRG